MKKVLASALAFSVSFGLLTSMDLKDAQAAEKDYVRLSGKDRLDTAIQISKTGWPTGLTSSEKSVILARSDNPVDALSAASLAGVKDAPILLTNTNSLDSRVLSEINRLGATKVYVLGSTGAISESVENTLKANNKSVTRLSGANRFDTAKKINEEAGTSKNTSAIVVNGDTVVDALSATSESAINKVPIYLTRTNNLPISLPSTVKNVVIYGSTGVVSSDVQNQLIKQGKTVKRISGGDRFSTNVAALKASTISFKNTILVRGTSVKTTSEDYPDAVAAGGLANKLHAKIVLTHPTNTNQTVKDYLSTDKLPTHVLGSSGTLTDSVLTGLGYDVDITKTLLSKDLLKQGKLPTMDVAIGATTNEVISKFGKPIEVYDNSREKVLYYDYDVFTYYFDYKTKKVDYIDAYEDKINMTESELISALGKPQESDYYPEDGIKTFYYEVGNYDFSVDIDPDSNKVTYMSLSVPFE